MKYIPQLTVILAVTLVAELLNILLPLPIPASIYGLFIMFICLMLKIIKLDQVDNVATFLVEIMPLTLIPASVGLISVLPSLASIIIPFFVIVLSSTIIVMIVTGKAVQTVINKKEEGSK